MKKSQIFALTVLSCLLLSCSGNSGARTSAGGTEYKPIELENGEKVTLGGFQFNVPKDSLEKKVAKGAKDNAGQITSVQISRPITKGEYEVPGARSAIVTISQGACINRMELLKRRANGWNVQYFLKSAQLPNLSAASKLHFESFALENKERYILEYVFERSAAGACLVVSTSIVKTVAQTFRPASSFLRLGADLKIVLDSVEYKLK